MGRLFWKFFFFIWLAQVIGMVGIGAAFWLEHHKLQSQWSQTQPQFQLPQAGQIPGKPPHAGVCPPPPNPAHRGAAFGGGEENPVNINRPPPPPPDGHGPRFIPVEPLIANILVTLLCSILLAWYFSKPIRSLRSAFDAAAEGNLDIRLGPVMGKRRDELADLGRDFDRMATRLQVLMNSQRHLLHDVSHELRSPLARLEAAVGLARQQPEKLEATMDRIELESTRINQLVGELLTLSRLEAGVVGNMQDEVNMDELISELMDDARFEAGARGCTVELKGDCDVIVQGREELLYRAIENVVRNAIKYTAQGGTVNLNAEYDAPRQVLKLVIMDGGPGVPTEEIGKIFEPFFRSGATGNTDGHGLGLAIALRVVQAHGGSIIASNRQGGGLCVQIELPAKKPSLPVFTTA